MVFTGRAYRLEPAGRNRKHMWKYLEISWYENLTGLDKEEFEI
jgi:hypothetical protein